MKLSKIALSIIPFALLTQVNATEHNLEVAGEISLFSPSQIVFRPTIEQNSLVQIKKLNSAATNTTI